MQVPPLHVLFSRKCGKKRRAKEFLGAAQRRLTGRNPKEYDSEEKKEESAMFNLANFVKACQGQPPSVIKELLEAALRDPASITEALAAIGAGKTAGEGSLGD